MKRSKVKRRNLSR